MNLARMQPTRLHAAVRRSYAITAAGGSGWTATLRLYYRDSELDGAREGDLQLWNYNRATQRWTRQGRTSSNTTANWVELAGVRDVGTWALASPAAVYLPLVMR